jgi:NAD(P)-dependent dehydrogenase (short-subunit alcohol dehydrogenase family)
LAGKRALVTGSSRGIGADTVRYLAAAGASVVVNGHRDSASVDAVVQEIRMAGGQAMGIMADVSDDAQIARLVQQTGDAYGSVDMVISNVAIRRKQAFLDITPQDWQDVLQTNLTPAYYLARHAIPHMLEKKWGRLVLISGFDGFWGQVPERAHNIAAKSGLHGLAMALAREFGSQGITANTVAPGAIDTVRDWTQYTHQDRQKIESEIPLGRYGKPDEVAAACDLLCSDRGAFISGQVIHVNGGHYMY